MVDENFFVKIVTILTIIQLHDFFLLKFKKKIHILLVSKLGANFVTALGQRCNSITAWTSHFVSRTGLALQISSCAVIR
jgi:hypothetical protein